jgi:hypothetical protein
LCIISTLVLCTISFHSFQNRQDTLKKDDITHNPQYAESAIDAMRAQKDEVYAKVVLACISFVIYCQRCADAGVSTVVICVSLHVHMFLSRSFVY